MSTPIVSVVITTKNEEENIANCLGSVKHQTYPRERIEIIVVDNNSADKTREIAQRYTEDGFNLPDLLDLTEVKNFRGAQLNFGVEKSEGEIIFFPDADMTFDEELLEEAVGLIREGRFDALYVPEVVVGRGVFGKIRNFERSFYNSTCVDAVRIVRRDLFLEVGGFDEKNIMFGPDDWDFTKRIREITNQIGITKNKIYHHEEQMAVRSYIYKKRNYINTFDGYINKWGKDDPDIKKQLGPYYRFIGVFVENGKWRKLIKHPILTLGMYFLRFLVGLEYLISEI